MQIVIDIPEDVYIARKYGDISPWITGTILDAVEQGTPIPDNATNGDVIKTFYPDAEYDTYFDFVAMTNHTERTVFESHFDRDWWDEPYQKGGKVE